MTLKRKFEERAEAKKALDRARLKQKGAEFDMARISRKAERTNERAILRALAMALTRNPRVMLPAIWGPLMEDCDDETRCMRAYALFDLMGVSDGDEVPHGYALTEEEALAPFPDPEDDPFCVMPDGYPDRVGAPHHDPA
jgi:hypothetical protein